MKTSGDKGTRTGELTLRSSLVVGHGFFAPSK